MIGQVLKSIGAVAAVVFLLAMCAPRGPDVPWEDYGNLQAAIDQAAAEKDCQQLQTMFDMADGNDANTRARTGHGNSDLMGYINDTMRDAGCYR